MSRPIAVRLLEIQRSETAITYDLQFASYLAKHRSNLGNTTAAEMGDMMRKLLILYASVFGLVSAATATVWSLQRPSTTPAVVD